MIYFIKHLKGIAYFLATLTLFQSCVAYNNNTSTIEEASSEKDMPIKIITKDGYEYELRWIEEKDGNVVSIKNSKREYINKSEIIQIIKYDPNPQVIPVESATIYNGTVQILLKDKKGNYKPREFIKIEEQGDMIKGYSKTGNDTLTIVIPIDQIEKIQLKDVDKSMGRTAGLVVGVVFGVGIIVLIVAFANAMSDGWYD